MDNLPMACPLRGLWYILSYTSTMTAQSTVHILSQHCLTEACVLMFIKASSVRTNEGDDGGSRAIGNSIMKNGSAELRDLEDNACWGRLVGGGKDELTGVDGRKRDESMKNDVQECDDKAADDDPRAKGCL
ncbi:hypothetical protein BJ165DRAFT_1405527 [Panaeolus papilionaceus]|nr:hypothetical protein BJ165DRAFT_1405527 [Panaeolus papilionaceus]